MDMKYEFEAGHTIETSVASCDKVIATWLRYEKQVFGTQHPLSHKYFALRAVQMQPYVIHSASK